MSGNPRNVQEVKPQARVAGEGAAPGATPLETRLREQAAENAPATRGNPAPTDDDARAANARLREMAANLDPRDEADHGGRPAGSGEDPLHVMERTVRAIVGHLETSDRRNADALRHVQNQIHTLAKGGGGAALGEIEKRLDTLARRIEDAGSGPSRPDPASLEQRIAGVAATITGDAQPPDTAPAEPSGDGDGYMSGFMRRQQRRRELMSGAAPAQAMPDIAGMIDEKTEEIEKRLLQRFTELSQSLRASQSKQAQPAKEIGDLQSLVKNLDERVKKLANKPAPPVYDDTEMRKAVNALHERLAAAEERFQGLDSLERTMGKLMTRLDDAEQMIRQHAATGAGAASEERLASLFEQLDDTRETMIAAARKAATEAAETKAGETARKAAEAALRDAQNAAVEAAREAARAYLAEAGPSHETTAEDTRVLASMQANLEQLRAEIDGTDYRSRAALESVQETIGALTARIAEAERKAGSGIVSKNVQAEAAASNEDAVYEAVSGPAPSASPAAEPEADERREPSFAASSKPDLPPELAEVRLPALEIPPLDSKSEFVRDEIARREANGTAEDFSAGPDRPREPGSGPPDAPHDHETVDTAAEVEPRVEPDAAAIGKAAAGDPDAVHHVIDDELFDEEDPDGRREPSMDAPAASLRSARTTNELLAAARRAAEAASGQAPRGDRKSLRDRLRIPRAGKGAPPKSAGPAKTETPKPAAPAKGGGKAANAKPAVRKPVILAVAAVILLAGSVEIYKIVKSQGGLPDIFSGGNSPSRIEAAKPSTPGDAPAPPAANAEKQINGMAPASAPPGEVTGSIKSAAPARSDDSDTGSAAADVDAIADAMTATGTAQPDSVTEDVTALVEKAAAPAGEQPADVPAANAGPTLPETFQPASLRDAAQAGDPVAQFEVASRLMEGRGADADSGAARQWFQRAAAAGLAPAQYRLGSIYEKGMGVEKDAQQARLWYQRAAEQGNRKAMHNLAVLYTDGIDGKPDFQTAARWFRAAADLGLSDSQYNLGILHVRGLGVPQNFSEAHKWFSIVAVKGDQDAAGRRDAIAERLDPDELAAARLAAQTWEAKPLVTEANAVRLPDDGWKFVAKSEPAPAGQEIAAADEITGTTRDAPAPQGDEMVRRVQELLTTLGFHPGPADGLMGPKTREAVTIFQLRTGAAPTGEITPGLVKKLLRQAG